MSSKYFASYWSKLQRSKRETASVAQNKRKYGDEELTFGELSMKLEAEGKSPLEIWTTWNDASQCVAVPVPADSDGQDRRVDPELSNTAVTYEQMCIMYKHQRREKTEEEANKYWEDLQSPDLAQDGAEADDLLGFIQLAEVFADKLFTAVDLNHDNKMSVKEIVSYGQKYMVFFLKICQTYTSMYLECWFNEIGGALIEDGYMKAGYEDISIEDALNLLRSGSLLFFLPDSIQETVDAAVNAPAAAAAPSTHGLATQAVVPGDQSRVAAPFTGREDRS